MYHLPLLATVHTSRHERTRLCLRSVAVCAFAPRGSLQESIDISQVFSKWAVSSRYIKILLLQLPVANEIQRNLFKIHTHMRLCVQDVGEKADERLSFVSEMGRLGNSYSNGTQMDTGGSPDEKKTKFSQVNGKGRKWQTEIFFQLPDGPFWIGLFWGFQTFVPPFPILNFRTCILPLIFLTSVYSSRRKIFTLFSLLETAYSAGSVPSYFFFFFNFIVVVSLVSVAYCSQQGHIFCRGTWECWKFKWQSFFFCLWCDQLECQFNLIANNSRSLNWQVKLPEISWPSSTPGGQRNPFNSSRLSDAFMREKRNHSRWCFEGEEKVGWRKIEGRRFKRRNLKMWIIKWVSIKR